MAQAPWRSACRLPIATGNSDIPITEDALSRFGCLAEIFEDIAQHPKCYCRLDLLVIVKYSAETLSVLLHDCKQQFSDSLQIFSAEEVIREWLVYFRLTLALNGFGVVGEIPLHHPPNYQLMDLRGCLGQLIEEFSARV